MSNEREKTVAELEAQLSAQTLELRTFKILADHAGDGVGIAGMDRKIYYANTAYRAMSGYGDRVIGMTSRDFVDESEHERLDREVRPALMTRGGWTGLLKLRRPDGSIWLGQGNLLILRDAAGAPFAHAAIYRDVTEQRRADEERIALQAQVIAAQEEALRELATPIVPIADGVLAMPLIGTINPSRAQQILDTLLSGITSQHVRIAILDITGVKVVDAAAANALVQAAKAASLLGAQVVLTGIGPTVARTLVGMGVDLTSIVTRGTLKEGIAHALQQ